MDYDDKGMPVAVIYVAAFENFWWRLFFRLPLARFLAASGIPLAPEFLVAGFEDDSSSPEESDMVCADSPW